MLTDELAQWQSSVSHHEWGYLWLVASLTSNISSVLSSRASLIQYFFFVSDLDAEVECVLSKFADKY